MKKFLTILAAIGLTATASTSVVACGSSKKADNNDDKGGQTDNTISKGNVQEVTQTQEATFTKAPTLEEIQSAYQSSDENTKMTVSVDPSDASKLAPSNTKNNVVLAAIQNDNEGIKINLIFTLKITITDANVGKPLTVKIEPTEAGKKIGAAEIALPPITVKKVNNASISFVKYDENSKTLTFKTTAIDDGDVTAKVTVSGFAKLASAKVENNVLSIITENNINTYGISESAFSYAPTPDTNPITFKTKQQGKGLTVSQDILQATSDANANRKEADHAITKAITDVNSGLQDELNASLGIKTSDQINDKYKEKATGTLDWKTLPVAGTKLTRGETWLNNGSSWWDLEPGDYYVALNNWDQDWNGESSVSTEIIKITVTPKTNTPITGDPTFKESQYNDETKTLSFVTTNLANGDVTNLVKVEKGWANIKSATVLNNKLSVIFSNNIHTMGKNTVSLTFTSKNGKQTKLIDSKDMGSAGLKVSYSKFWSTYPDNRGANALPDWMWFAGAADDGLATSIDGIDGGATNTQDHLDELNSMGVNVGKMAWWGDNLTGQHKSDPIQDNINGVKRDSKYKLDGTGTGWRGRDGSMIDAWYNSEDVDTSKIENIYDNVSYLKNNSIPNWSSKQAANAAGPNYKSMDSWEVGKTYYVSFAGIKSFNGPTNASVNLDDQQPVDVIAVTIVD